MAKASLVVLLSTVIVAAAAVGETAHRGPRSDQQKLDLLFTKLVDDGRILITDSTTVGEFRELFQKMEGKECWKVLTDAKRPKLDEILQGGNEEEGSQLNDSQRECALHAVNVCHKEILGEIFWERFFPHGYDHFRSIFTIKGSDEGFKSVVPKVSDKAQAQLWALQLLQVATDPDVQAICKDRGGDRLDMDITRKSQITLVPDLQVWYRAVVEYAREYNPYSKNPGFDLSDPKKLKKEILTAREEEEKARDKVAGAGAMMPGDMKVPEEGRADLRRALSH
eukprot:GHVU01204959.1.p1 GENE.GHVU01204959.1~~GHVU01204959.1.p1  ORF type:complete len:281 (-),score=31.23 GHVU01204959.1:374-1216(-)